MISASGARVGLIAKSRVIEVVWAIALGSAFWCVMVGLFVGDAQFNFEYLWIYPLRYGIDDSYWWTYFAVNVASYFIVRSRAMYADLKIDLALERRAKKSAQLSQEDKNLVQQKRALIYSSVHAVTAPLYRPKAEVVFLDSFGFGWKWAFPLSPKCDHRVSARINIDWRGLQNGWL